MIKKYWSNPWVESISDTVLALIINFPLNIMMLWCAKYLELTVIQTSVFLTIIFTVVAIVRKVFTRKYFNKHSCQSGDKSI